MLATKALKSELAKAVLAFGIAGATPVFAQDTAGVPVSDIDATVETVVASDQHLDWYNPQIPQNVLFGLMLLAMAGTGYAVYRKTDGTVARSVGLAIAFTAIANPQNVMDQFRTLPTIIPVFVDESLSVGDRAPMVEEAFEELETRLSLLGPVSIRRVEFGNDDASRARPGTHFADVYQSTLDSIPREQFGGGFVISDGVLSDQSRFLDVVNDTAPIHSLIVGHDQEQDFYVRIEEAPQIGIIGEEQDITFRIVDGRSSDSADLFADVALYYGGNHVSTINVPLNQSHTIRLSDIYPEGLQLGQNLIEIAIDAVQGARVGAMDRDGDGQPDEVTMDNNRIITSIEGIDSDIRVLLISGEPYPGTRLWRNILMDDPNVSLTHLGMLRPPAKEDATPLRDLATVAFPVNELLRERIDEFDMIVIDNYRYNGIIPIEYFTDIHDYVLEGGSLLVVGAEDLVAPNSIANTILGDIIPLIPSDFTIDQSFVPQISETGERHPVSRTIAQSGAGQNWGPWYSIADSEARDDAVVLMTDQQNNPLLALDYVGEGRIAMLASDQNAIWASGHLGGGPASVVYRSLSGWLTGVQRYNEENLTLRQQAGQIVVELQTMGETAEPIVIIAPSGQEIEVMPEEVSPGLFAARIPADERGAYRARRTSNLAVEAYMGSGFDDTLEIQNVISETEILRPLTDQTGGQTVRISDVSGSFELPPIVAANDLETLNQENAVEPLVVDLSERRELVGSERKPIIPGWIYALAFAGAMLYSFKPKDKTHAEWARSPFAGRRRGNSGADAPRVA